MKKIILLAASVLFTLTAEAQIKRPQPKSGPMPTVTVKKPKEFTLKNGLKVLVVEDHKLPKVSYMLTIDTPPYAEGDIVGVSSLTSAVVGNGTTKTSKVKFDDEVDFLGASVGFWNSGASASGLSKYSDRLLELLVEGSLTPIFTQEEFKKAQDNAIENLKNEEKSVASVASKVENALVYGTNHPNGEFITEASLRKVTLEDVKKNYKDYFVPEKAYLVIVGDVDYKKVKKQVEKLFGGWKKAEMPKTEIPKVKNVAKTQIDFIDMPNAVQSEIALVNTYDLKLSDPDYFPLIMANQILGGGGEGRLFLNLREAHGWTYGAYSSASAGKYTTKFKASASVRNTVTDSAVVEFMNELDRIQKTKATQEELDLAKAKYIGNFVMETQKPGTIASFALRTETQNLPADFYEKFIANINNVTIDDVQRVANKYFLKDNMRIIIAGKGADVADGLEKLGYTVNYYDKNANKVSKPVFKKEVPAGVTSKTVIENHIKAIGGENKLKTVKSISQTSKGNVPQGGEFTMIQKQTNKNEFMLSLNGMGMELMKQVITPKMGYVSGQGQKQVLKGEELAEAQKSIVLFSEFDDLKNASEFTLTGIESFNGEDAYALKKDETITYYSVANGYKIGESTTMEVQGQSQVLTKNYSDYKEVKGVKIPHKFTVPMLGDAEFTITELKINEGVSDADFK